MFHSIAGELTGKNTESVFILTSGIEWDIAVSATTLGQLHGLGSEVKLFLYLHHTEDQMRLYGFATLQERTVFLELLKVSGIGPKAAQKILSALTPAQLTAALESGDPAQLSKAPGVGLKTAQKILLALKGKLVLDETPVKAGPLSELATSLVQMGFDRRQVELALAEIETDAGVSKLSGDAKEKAVFQRALVWLSTH